MELSIIDFIVFLVFIVGILLFGCSFYLKNKNATDYT